MSKDKMTYENQAEEHYQVAVNYADVSIEDAERILKELSEAPKAIQSDFYKTVKGKNVVRFLPALPGREAIQFIWKHTVTIDGKPVMFTCPRMQAGKPCAKCKQADELRRSDNEVDRKSANKSFPNKRGMANVYNRSADCVQVFDMAQTIYTPLLNLVGNGFSIFNPSAEGVDVVVVREDKSNKVEYAVQPSGKRSALHADPKRAEELIAQQFDLSKYAQLPSAEFIADVMEGINPYQKQRN